MAVDTLNPRSWLYPTPRGLYCKPGDFYVDPAVAPLNPRSWLYPTPRGLYCKPGDFYVDPAVAVPRAVITHGHGDHARPGHRSALATPETLAIMRARFEDMPDTDPQPPK